MLYFNICTLLLIKFQSDFYIKYLLRVSSVYPNIEYIFIETETQEPIDCIIEYQIEWSMRMSIINSALAIEHKHRLDKCRYSTHSLFSLFAKNFWHLENWELFAWFLTFFKYFRTFHSLSSQPLKKIKISLAISNLLNKFWNEKLNFRLQGIIFFFWCKLRN